MVKYVFVEYGIECETREPEELESCISACIEKFRSIKEKKACVEDCVKRYCVE